MISYIGSKYGGHFLDLDLVPKDSWVISAGIGGDISFDLELIEQKNCHIIAIDPTFESEKFVNGKNIKNIQFIRKALFDESQLIVGIGAAAKTYLAKKAVLNCQTITLENILSLCQQPPSVLKMDIEGAEYPVIQSINRIDIPQICIEFHHWLGDNRSSSKNQVNNTYTILDTINCIKKLAGLGYQLKKISAETRQRKVQETLFIKWS